MYKKEAIWKDICVKFGQNSKRELNSVTNGMNDVRDFVQTNSDISSVVLTRRFKLGGYQVTPIDNKHILIFTCEQISCG